MNRFPLLAALLLTIGLLGLAGCPSTVGDDDSGEGSPELCDVDPGCASNAACPEQQPAAGDTCTFTGNCHYCFDEDGVRQAYGYSCDGVVFASQGQFVCE